MEDGEEEEEDKEEKQERRRRRKRRCERRWRRWRRCPGLWYLLLHEGPVQLLGRRLEALRQLEAACGDADASCWRGGAGQRPGGGGVNLRERSAQVRGQRSWVNTQLGSV